jgi:hypothetical protein
MSRYGFTEMPLVFKRERPGGRILSLHDDHQDLPIMITEFGGIAYSKDAPGTWGYSRAANGDDLAERYIALLRAIRGIPTLAGFCYTQFADTYQESNGLLFADRTPKFPLDLMASATSGPQTSKQYQIEREWRDRLMSTQRTRYQIHPEDHRTSHDPQ